MVIYILSFNSPQNPRYGYYSCFTEETPEAQKDSDVVRRSHSTWQSPDVNLSNPQRIASTCWQSCVKVSNKTLHRCYSLDAIDWKTSINRKEQATIKKNDSYLHGVPFVCFLSISSNLHRCFFCFKYHFTVKKFGLDKYNLQ